MHKIGLTLTATLAIVGAMIGGRSHAAVIAPIGLGAAADELAAVETVQFTWQGRPFCWYNTGWRGPGWYQCGFRWRRGLGWGGPVGWRGWRRPGIAVGQGPNRPGINRPGGNRPGITTGQGGNRPGINRPGGNRPGAGNRPGGNRPSTTGQGGGRPGGGSSGRNRGGGRS